MTPTDFTPSEANRGASIRMEDKRVSQALNWLYGVFGTAFIGLGLWIGTSINELNLNMARVLVKMDQQKSTDDGQDSDISALKADVRELQGKTFRGVAGYEKEPKRGR